MGSYCLQKSLKAIGTLLLRRGMEKYYRNKDKRFKKIDLRSVLNKKQWRILGNKRLQHKGIKEYS